MWARQLPLGEVIPGWVGEGKNSGVSNQQPTPTGQLGHGTFALKGHQCWALRCPWQMWWLLQWSLTFWWFSEYSILNILFSGTQYFLLLSPGFTESLLKLFISTDCISCHIMNHGFIKWNCILTPATLNCLLSLNCIVYIFSPLSGCYSG